MNRITVLLIVGFLFAGSAAVGGAKEGVSIRRDESSSTIVEHDFSVSEGGGRKVQGGSTRKAELPSLGIGSVRARAPRREKPFSGEDGGQNSVSAAPIPYTSSAVQSDYKVFPLSTNGRLFTTFLRGTRTCSGTVISSGSGNPRGVVLTAARCVYNESMGGFAAQALFIPAYSGASPGPFGDWTARYAFVPSQWIENENVRFDVATLYIPPKLDGETLEKDNTGGMGLRWNQPIQTLSTNAFGYPDAGGQLFRCISETHSAWPPQPPPPGDPTYAIGCDLPEEGTAGGGWVVEEPDDSYLVSLFSYKVEDENEVSFGPYFNTTTATLYEEAATADLVTHKMKLTFKLKGRLTASGRITARDGYRPCGNKAPIRIQRKKPNKWKTIKKTLSKSSGRYKVGIPNKPGRYRAFSPAGSVDAYNFCSSAKSQTRKN